MEEKNTEKLIRQVETVLARSEAILAEADALLSKLRGEPEKEGKWLESKDDQAD